MLMSKHDRHAHAACMGLMHCARVHGGPSQHDTPNRCTTASSAMQLPRCATGAWTHTSVVHPAGAGDTTHNSVCAVHNCTAQCCAGLRHPLVYSGRHAAPTCARMKTQSSEHATAGATIKKPAGATPTKVSMHASLLTSPHASTS